MEYGAGTNALDASSHPTTSLSFEDLSGIGLRVNEPVFSFRVAADRNDLSPLPQTSTDLLHWNFAPLQFLDATDLGSSKYQFCFRLTNTSAPTRFFRSGTSGD
jgi:hypothetical protein